MALTLYVGTKRYSSWSLRPYSALAHAGASFTTETIALDQLDTKAKIAAVNPARRVPVLHDGDLVITESLAICEYVAELRPPACGPTIAPNVRARVPPRPKCTPGSPRCAARCRPGAKKPGIGRTVESLADIARVTEIWRDQLAASGPFCSAFTIADAMFAPVATRFETYEVELDAPCAAYVRALAELRRCARGLVTPPKSRLRVSAETCAAIASASCGHSAAGRSWPMPSITMSSAPRIAAAVRACRRRRTSCHRRRGSRVASLAQLRGAIA